MQFRTRPGFDSAPPNRPLLQQWVGNLSIQRTGVQDNTLGLGVTGFQDMITASGECAPGYYVVTMSARTGTGEGAVGPTPTIQALANGQRSVPAQFRVRFSDGSPWDIQIDVDGGQGVSVGTWAQTASVALLLDAQTVVVPSPGQTGNTVVAGGVINAQVYATIRRQEVAPPLGTFRSTVSKTVPISTNASISIPPWTTSVQVLQDASAPAGVEIIAPASGPWHFLNAAGAIVGILPFVPGERYTPVVRIPGPAAFLQPERDNSAARFFSSIFVGQI